MRRRECIRLLGGLAVWPVAARAQQPAKPVIGFVHAASGVPSSLRQVTALRQGLQGLGFVDGQNVTLELHWAEGHYDRLPAIIDDMVRRKVAVIMAGGGTAGGEAAKAATKTIPIVFITGDDPVRVGLVDSLNRPGGNVTGVLFFNSALTSKRMEIVRELLPDAKVVAYIVNPNSRNAQQEVSDGTAAARSLGFELHLFNAATTNDIDSCYDKIAPLHAQALIIAADPFLGGERDHSIGLGNRLGIPVIGTTRDYVPAGGVLNYGTSLLEAYEHAGAYAGRILKGEKPADLPVTQPTRFELSINLKAAKALHITVPPSLLARADEVIE
jgi:putative ABC transport system substrate-binding protein